MSKISKLIAIVLLIFGFALAAFSLFSSGNKKSIDKEYVDVSREHKLFDVVVANKDLSPGHSLRKEDLEIKREPEMIAGSFKDMNDAVGKTVAQDIQKDKAIFRSQLVGGVAGLVMEGERAVSIKVDEASAVGHKIQPGDWVDVFVVLKRDSQEINATQARMVLPRRKVIAYGARIHGESIEEDSKNKESAAVARTAVIAVKVEEVNRLLLAEQQGQVQLALRNPLDQNEPSADMLKQLPGLSVRKGLNQDVSDATAAINDSLAAIRVEDLAKEVGSVLAMDKVAGKPGQIRKKSSSTQVAESGVVVEVIRGTRKETVRY
jgi:pilus assembly protein CpaB